MDPGTLAAILTIGTIVVGAVSAGTTHLLGRRMASGRVSTSEASVLWQQSQDMRATLLAEKAKAEEQRDKFIASYTEQVLPMLESINRLVTDLTGAVAEGLTMLTANSALLRGGDVHALAPQGSGGADRPREPGA